MANETAKAAAAATAKSAKAAAAATAKSAKAAAAAAPVAGAPADTGTQDSAEQAPAAQAPAVQAAAAPEIKPKTAATAVESLETFIRRTEIVHLERDVVLVEVSHPQALSDSYPGTYGGIRLKKGQVGVRYSDGSTE